MTYCKNNNGSLGVAIFTIGHLAESSIHTLYKLDHGLLNTRPYMSHVRGQN